MQKPMETTNDPHPQTNQTTSCQSQDAAGACAPRNERRAAECDRCAEAGVRWDVWEAHTLFTSKNRFHQTIDNLSRCAKHTFTESHLIRFGRYLHYTPAGEKPTITPFGAFDMPANYHDRGLFFVTSSGL